MGPVPTRGKAQLRNTENKQPAPQPGHREGGTNRPRPLTYRTATVPPGTARCGRGSQPSPERHFVHGDSGQRPRETRPCAAPPPLEEPRLSAPRRADCTAPLWDATPIRRAGMTSHPACSGSRARAGRDGEKVVARPWPGLRRRAGERWVPGGGARGRPGAAAAPRAGSSEPGVGWGAARPNCAAPRAVQSHGGGGRNVSQRCGKRRGERLRYSTLCLLQTPRLYYGRRLGSVRTGIKRL